VNLVRLQRISRSLRTLGWLPVALLLLALSSVIALAAGTIASSSFVGFEDPLSENGAWVTITSYSPYGTQFQKNNGALADRLSPLNHAVSRTITVVPADHYSEIVVGHIGTTSNNVGPIARVQTSGPATDSLYLWWASIANGANFLYRLDANVPDPNRGTTYTANALTPTSPVVDGDRLRLITRGQVLYGLKNGVRDFIYNTGTDATKYTGGTTGIMAYADGAVNNAIIASWSTGPAPVSSGTWTASSFVGTEKPLDEGDRWYPLPGYAGFQKTGGQVIGLQPGHNASGAWSIAPPATQYSQVTLGNVATGGGGPIVRIDRNNPGQTGWLLFLYADNPSSSGIYKMTPDGNFIAVQLFTPTIVAGDKWRLTATGNTLNVYQNGLFQLTYTTDGSYASGDVGMEAYTPAFTFAGWSGGDPAADPGAPTVTGVLPMSGLTTGGTPITISGTNFVAGATVALGGTPATGVTVVNSATITAITPVHTLGPVNVTVSGANGESGVLTNGYTYVLPPPTLVSITPGSAFRGTSFPVTLTGTNFAPIGTSVAITGPGVDIGHITVVDLSTITTTFTISAKADISARTVNVSTPSGTTSTLPFTVLGPVLTSIAPATGALGTNVLVTLTGTGLSGANGVVVTGNGVNVTGFSVVNDTTVMATIAIAPGAKLSGRNVMVNTAVNGTSNNLTFTIVR